MKFARAFMVRGNLERAFDLTEKYVSGMKFRTVNSVKPSMLVLEQGSLIGSVSSYKIESSRTTLSALVGVGSQGAMKMIGSKVALAMALVSQ